MSKKVVLTLIVLIAGTILYFGFADNFEKPFIAKSPKTNVKNKTNLVLSDAFWISDNRKLPANDSLFYLDNPAPIFRKEFKPKYKVDSATLYITSAGYYNASINGNKIGKNELDPAWTDYSKRIYFTSYDITDQIVEGDNCLGVTLGNGFYNPLPLKKWGRRNPRVDLNVGKPQFIAKLIIQYHNGKTEELITDDSWKYTYGPIIKNSVYLGTAYDGRKEIRNWNEVGLNDTSWSKAVIKDGPGGRLQEAFFPPVQITEKINPTRIELQKKDTYVVDMGVNFTGTYRIKLSGEVGDTITFRFGERIYDDGTLNPMTTVIGQIKKKGIGGPGAPEIAWQTDSYIIGKNTPVWYQPKFTYHTFRYMEIVGLKEKPEISDIQGLAFHSNVPNNNSFSSSSDLLNAIQKAANRTFLSNLISVQSDCPTREKFGYGGDLNAVGESYLMNYDMQSFYRKTVYDWVDAVRDSTFVDTAPYAGIQYCGLSWESALLITQYNLYLYYKDIDFIKELYKFDLDWMDKVARIHPEGIVDNGLSDHESLEPVPVELTGTAHYLQCAEIMQTFASVMKDQENEKKYAQLAKKLRGIIKAKFWEVPVTEKINRQTLFATLLYHKIIPPTEIEAAQDSLANALDNGPSGHLNTGIFGTKYALETISEHLSPDAAFDMVNSTAFPGWGFMIDQGATTLWETWAESDDVYSNCHPMLGSVSEWFYRWLGGIRPDPENPGFKKFILAPNTPKDLNHVQTSYESPYGTIISNWERNPSGTIIYELEIPERSVAITTLPVDALKEIKILKDGSPLKAENIKNMETGNFELIEGNYLITLFSH